MVEFTRSLLVQNEQGDNDHSTPIYTNLELRFVCQVSHAMILQLRCHQNQIDLAQHGFRSPIVSQILGEDLPLETPGNGYISERKVRKIIDSTGAGDGHGGYGFVPRRVNSTQGN